MMSKIIIYGAGVYGKKCMAFLNSLDVKVDYFAQTEIETERVIDGISLIDIKELAEMDEQKIIFVALKDERLCRQLLKQIRENVSQIKKIYTYNAITAANLEGIIYTGDNNEIRKLAPYWIKYFSNELELKAAENDLIAGLELEDQKKVERIIARLKEIIVEGNQNRDFFTVREEEEIVRLENEFYPNIKEDTENGIWHYGTYKLQEPHFEESVFYYKCGINYLKDIAKLQNKDIIDAGAYIGDSAIVLSEYTVGNVYAFEAFKENFDKIEQTAKLNQKYNIIPVNLALGATNEEKSFFIRNDTNGGHGIVKRDAVPYCREIKVRQVALDEFVEAHNLKVGLIKADIEGAEQFLLDGAINTICTQKPAMLISIYHTADDFFQIKRKIEELNLGYSFKIAQSITRGTILLETMLVCEVI